MKNSHLNKIDVTQFVPQRTTFFSLFVLTSNGMILKQPFSLKLRVWYGILLKKMIRLWSKLFPGKWDFELKVFWHVLFELRIYRSEDIENKTFRIIIFQRKTNFEKINFWIQFLRNGISMKKSYLKKKSFWLSLSHTKRQNFHFSCLF